MNNWTTGDPPYPTTGTGGFPKANFTPIKTPQSELDRYWITEFLPWLRADGRKLDWQDNIDTIFWGWYIKYKLDKETK